MLLYTVGVLRDLREIRSTSCVRLVVNNEPASLDEMATTELRKSMFYIAVNHEENPLREQVITLKYGIKSSWYGSKTIPYSVHSSSNVSTCLVVLLVWQTREKQDLVNGIYREQRNMNSRFIVLCGVSVGQMRNSEKPANNTCRYSVLIFINLQMT